MSRMVGCVSDAVAGFSSQSSCSDEDMRMTRAGTEKEVKVGKQTKRGESDIYLYYLKM